MVKEINDRRSIRRFTRDAVSERDIKEILGLAIQAPSAKNRQPWKFIITQDSAKEEMIRVFSAGLDREESAKAVLPDSRRHIKAARYTIEILKQAPVVIFVMNTEGKGLFADLSREERMYETANIESVSAAVQNMLLGAAEKGLGSLWICDIFFAYEELCEWLNSEGELLAAVALGVPDEQPKARPRKKLDDVIEWRS